MVNTVKEFVKFGFLNINKIVDSNVIKYFRLRNNLSIIINNFHLKEIEF